MVFLWKRDTREYRSRAVVHCQTIKGLPASERQHAVPVTVCKQKAQRYAECIAHRQPAPANKCGAQGRLCSTQLMHSQRTGSSDDGRDGWQLRISRHAMLSGACLKKCRDIQCDDSFGVRLSAGLVLSTCTSPKRGAYPSDHWSGVAVAEAAAAAAWRGMALLAGACAQQPRK